MASFRFNIASGFRILASQSLHRLDLAWTSWRNSIQSYIPITVTRILASSPFFGLTLAQTSWRIDRMNHFILVSACCCRQFRHKPRPATIRFHVPPPALSHPHRSRNYPQNNPHLAPLKATIAPFHFGLILFLVWARRRHNNVTSSINYHHPHRRCPRICLDALVDGSEESSSPFKASMVNHHALFYSDDTITISSFQFPSWMLNYYYSSIHRSDWKTPPLSSSHLLRLAWTSWRIDWKMLCSWRN